MIVRDRVYTIDDVWRLSQQPENEHKFIYLIDGELFFMPRPGGLHGLIASLIAHFLWTYVLERDLGQVTTETGYHPPGDRTTLLGPDVGFVHRERAPEPFPLRFVPVMPDLAVEVFSPSNTMPELRRKTEVYLRQGVALVWLVNPEEKTVEVWRKTAADELTSEAVGADGVLSGEPVLPGFTLALDSLFSRV